MSQASESNSSAGYGDGKEAILKSAIYLFTSKGYQKTTLKDLSAESGVNTALISYHFGGKEGLMRAVLEKKLSIFDQMFLPSEKLGSSISMDNFIHFIDRSLEEFHKDASFFHVIQWNYLDGGMFAETINDKVCQRIEERIAKVIRILNPKLSQEDAMVSVLMLGSLLMKYAELKWHYPKFRSFKEPNPDFQKRFKTRLLKQIKHLIHS
ncbi:MAG: TetR/AcrR family transcriptional regulator [Bdellovibrionales bacterium]